MKNLIDTISKNSGLIGIIITFIIAPGISYLVPILRETIILPIWSLFPLCFGALSLYLAVNGLLIKRRKYKGGEHVQTIGDSHNDMFVIRYSFLSQSIVLCRRGKEIISYHHDSLESYRPRSL